MAEQLLNCAEVGPVGKQVRGKRVPQRVRVQVPVHVDQAHIFLTMRATDRGVRRAPK